MTQKNKQNSFARGAMLLAVSSLVAKLLGAIYRIPLTNILGAQGIGQYQLVFPLFALLLALSCGAIPVALARIVAYKMSLGDYIGVKSTMLSALIFALLGGGIICLFMLALAKPLSIIQGNPDIFKCYLTIAPAIILIAVANIFKGWFLGYCDMLPTSIGQLAEQIAKLSVGIALAKLFISKGLSYGVVGALLGVTISELVGLVIMFLFYVFSKKKGKGFRIRGFLSSSRELSRISLPIMASGLIFPIIAFTDSVIIIKLLSFFGLDSATATSQFGLLNGTVNSLINMPVVISLSLAIAIVPAISSFMAKGDIMSVKEKTAMSIKLSYLVGIPCFFGMFIFAKAILTLLYPSLTPSQLQLGASIMRVLSVNIILLSQLEIFNAMLQGLDRSKDVLLNLAIGGLVKILLQSLLIPKIGIIGACVGTISFYLISWILNSCLYQKLVGKNNFLFNNVSKIMVSGVIMASVIWLVSLIPLGKMKLPVGIIVGVIIYAFCIIIFKVLSTNELEMLPFGKFLARKRLAKEKK